MEKNLDCAARALDYSVTDSLRWSRRFQLLKRAYCIDSWDFQVDDEYTPSAPLSPTMMLVPGKTKFGIFFGDNTGYYDACNQLSEMFEHAGHTEQAVVYKERGKKILERLVELSWNGRFFTHFIDDDPSVKRDLGVDEKSQIAQGNMYSINRGLPHSMNVAIINTYLGLRKNLPPGSPGEWYSIYPPFEKGFGTHDAKWQYMNGGVAGHAMGELARGAYENGFEDYASDIMKRMLDLAKQYREPSLVRLYRIHPSSSANSGLQIRGYLFPGQHGSPRSRGCRHFHVDGRRAIVGQRHARTPHRESGISRDKV